MRFEYPDLRGKTVEEVLAKLDTWCRVLVDKLNYDKNDTTFEKENDDRRSNV